MSVENNKKQPLCREQSGKRLKSDDFYGVHQLFEQQVEKSPEAVAVVSNDRQIAYDSLNRKANRLARLLYRQGVGAGTVVGVCLERSLEMIVTVLAILKTGGGYLPLDVNYPAERIKYMVESADLKLIVTSKDVPFDDVELGQCCCIDDADFEKQLLELGSDNLTEMDYQPDSPAYMMFTSGSTGKPKGVVVSQHNLLCYTQAAIERYQLSASDRMLQFSAFSFDIFVEETFTTLASGGALVLRNEQMMQSGEDFWRFVQSHQVSVISLPTAYWHALCAQLQQDGFFADALKLAIIGGEAMSVAMLQRWQQIVGLDVKLLNVYGPTETTSVATSYDCAQWQHQWQSVPIGRPLANTLCYVLDENMQPCQIEQQGELYIGGDSVATGYYGKVQLTAERFVKNPFVDDPDARMYKTGDLVSLLPDGNLMFAGRIDEQVKIAGFRIEPGEIEYQLTLCRGVEGAVVTVVADKHESKRIAAYVVARTNHGQFKKDLLAELANKLPGYMMPRAIVLLDELPLTPNGKVDKKRLPLPQFEGIENYVAPQSQLQTTLCALFAEILKVENVGIEDSFFQLGGHSINAMKLSSACRKSLGLSLPLATLFKHKTVKAIAEQLPLLSQLEVLPPITKQTQSGEPVALSYAQQRLLFIERLEQGSSVYHIPELFKLTRAASLGLLAEAFNVLVKRHPVLISCYQTANDGEDYQLLCDEPLSIAQVSVHSLSQLPEQIKTQIEQPFDLTCQPSIRIFCYLCGDERYLLVLFHHIAIDGWSLEPLFGELGEIYQALTDGDVVPLPEAEISYGDYALWQRQLLQGERLNKLQQYWLAQLQDFETLQLPADKPRPHWQQFEGRVHAFQLDEVLSEQLRALAKTQQCTLYSVLLSGLYVTAALLSAQQDIVLGTPSDNRHHEQTQSLVGFFVNSLPLRVKLDFANSIEYLLGQVQQIVVQAKTHQDLPFDQMVELLQVERDTSRHPIFQLMFSLQDFELDHCAKRLPFESAENLRLEDLHSPALFDLSMVLCDRQKAIQGKLTYALSLFEPSSVARISRVYQQVLAAFVCDVKLPLDKIDVLTEAERHQQLVEFNPVQQDWVVNETLVELFESQAAAQPDAIALVDENQQLSYRQVNQKANQLARKLGADYQAKHDKTIPADTIVALYFDRNVDMVVAMLAVLKAGAAFVALSPQYPRARIEYIVADTHCAFILSQHHFEQQLRQWFDDVSVLAIDDTKVLAGHSGKNLNLNVQSVDLAYIIYTSGTTGQPKGVMIQHNNLLALLYNDNFNHQLSRSCCWTSYTFDVSMYEIFSALHAGSELHLLSDDTRLDEQRFFAYLVQHGIEFSYIPPFFIKPLGEYLNQHANHQLRWILTGVEKILTQDALPLIALGVTFINGYGPSETTTCSTALRVVEADCQSEVIPIGKPLIGEYCFVLSPSRQLLLQGTPGELYIGGAGVSRGYLNNPQLTTEKFVDNPFADEGARSRGFDRLYRTGDKVRWLADGKLEFIERVDNQVKIRGFRIEPGEIESQLQLLPQINQAVVLVQEDRHGQPQLIAYITANQPQEPSQMHQQLSDALSFSLPAHMIPAQFVLLEQLPLTTNGKVDKRALPQPQWRDNSAYMAPSNDVEQALVDMWQSLLSIDSKIGINANFFELGGHSLLATKLSTQIQLRFAVEIELKAIFDAKSINNIGRLISQKLADGETSQAQRVGVFHQDSEYDMEEFEL